MVRRGQEAVDVPGDDDRTVRVLVPAPASAIGVAGGRRVRARIVQRRDGLFGFVEEVALGPDEHWMALPGSATICDTAEAAEREARAVLPWIRNAQD